MARLRTTQFEGLVRGETPLNGKKKQDPVSHWGKEANDDDDDTRLILFSYCIMFICETRRIQLEIVSHNFNTVEL